MALISFPDMNIHISRSITFKSYIWKKVLVFNSPLASLKYFHVGKPCHPRRTSQVSPRVLVNQNDQDVLQNSTSWPDYVSKSEKKGSLEKHIATPFGHIRIDDQNTPNYHGQQDCYEDEVAEATGGTRDPLTQDVNDTEPAEIIGESGEIMIPQHNAFKSNSETIECLEYYKEDAQDSSYSKIQFIEFNEELDNKSKLKKSSNVVQHNMTKEVAKDSYSPESFIDEHYFNQILQTDNSTYKEIKSEPTTTTPVREHKRCSMNEIDAQYFSTLNLMTTTHKENKAVKNEKEASEMKQLRLKDVIIDKDDKLNSIDCQMFGNDECSSPMASPSLSKQRPSTKKKKDKAPKKSPTALEYVNKMRKGFKFDVPEQSYNKRNTREQEIIRIGESLQSRIGKVAMANKADELKDRIRNDDEDELSIENSTGQVNTKFLPENIERLTTTEVENIIRRSVVYNDHDIVAFHKPYGLQMFGQSKGNRHSVDNLLHCLYDQLGVEQTDSWPGLMPVHRLDKNTTGILLCAKTEDKHNLLTNLFRQRKILKRYWAILNGTPNVDDGIIDIPLGSIKLKGRHRLTLQPDYSNSKVTNKRKYKGDILPAVTEYSVLKTRGNASLVEVRPTTGFKHQIRAHLGLGLSTPILGDHKYSRIAEFNKPQKVHGDILHRLEVRSSRSRDLPVCLHAKRILIPDIIVGKYVSIDCNLPHFFVKIMKKLGLKPNKIL